MYRSFPLGCHCVTAFFTWIITFCKENPSLTLVFTLITVLQKKSAVQSGSGNMLFSLLSLWRSRKKKRNLSNLYGGRSVCVANSLKIRKVEITSINVDRSVLLTRSGNLLVILLFFPYQFFQFLRKGVTLAGTY